MTRVWLCLLALIVALGAALWLESAAMGIVAWFAYMISGLFIRCGWCGRVVFLHDVEILSVKLLMGALPFDGDCPNCLRSLWTMPPAE
jgi:hypothetical protein